MALILADPKCLEEQRQSKIELVLSLITMTESFERLSARSKFSAAHGCAARITHILKQRQSHPVSAMDLRPS